MNRFLTRSVALAALVLSLGACDTITDLETENRNDPDLRRALTNPSDVEAMIASSWVSFYTYTNGSSTHTVALSALAHQLTSTVANYSVLELSAEPRNWQFNNHPAYSERWINQSPWYSWYGGLASANDGLRLIDDGMQMFEGSGDDRVDTTPRAYAFGKFTQGLLIGQYALNFDQAMVATEETDFETDAPEYIPYPDVQARAIASLEEAIATAEQNVFVLPAEGTPSWFPGIDVTNEELVRIAHSYIARLLAYTPRSPAERAAVDWDQVLYHLDRGIQQDHAPVLDGSGSLPNWYRWRTQMSWFRIDYRTLGPADVSGQYQQWINAPVSERDWFIIETPDQRIAGENRTTDRGTYFYYTAAQGVLREDRGRYNFSHYAFDRWGGSPEYYTGPQEIMPMVEMDLLRAEAYIRLNREAEAVPLINSTRVANGGLPDVTAAGVPADADCVPRTNSGDCGSLFDALMYEKLIETVGTTGELAWFDRRGWGTLASGSFTQLPVPGRELETLGLPLYTFGGGGVGSAD